MLVSNQESALYQHPRWFVCCAAIGFAFFYACAFSVANIFPHGDQQHGWPFVYMVRAWLVPGGLTILYGPWPLDNPPIVKFWPAMLFLNVLCGGLLATVATVVPVYWLRLRQKPVHFSLRSLFVLTTGVACILGLLKWFFPQANCVWYAAAIVSEASWLAVVFFPACLMVIAAHGLVVRPVAVQRRSRWLGLHWLAWLAVCFAGGPLLHYSIFTSSYGVLGWPLRYDNTNHFSWSAFNLPALVGDLAVCLAVTAATGFVVERWVFRVELHAPLRKRALSAAALAVLFRIWLLYMDQSRQPEWYDYYSWFFGPMAAIYATEVLTARHWNKIPKTSLLAGIAVGAPLWIILAPLLADDRFVAGLSLQAGACAVTMVDAGRRTLMHRDQGSLRFIRPDCGEHVAVLPMWAVGLIGIAGGLALAYT